MIPHCNWITKQQTLISVKEFMEVSKVSRRAWEVSCHPNSQGYRHTVLPFVEQVKRIRSWYVYPLIGLGFAQIHNNYSLTTCYDDIDTAL